MVYDISLLFIPLTSKCSVSQSSELQFIAYGIDLCQESVSAVMPFSPPHHPLLLTIGDCILNLKANTWVGNTQRAQAFISKWQGASWKDLGAGGDVAEVRLAPLLLGEDHLTVV